MPKICLAFDQSSSLSKGLYCCQGNRMSSTTLELITMEPDVVKVPQESYSQLQAENIGGTLPENEALVGLEEQYYAVGFLALSQLYSYDTLKQLKYQSAVPKVLAMVGAIATKKRLPSKWGLDLGILLPYGEYQDRLKLKEELSKALSNFSFRQRNYQVRLESFLCLPEGAGVLLRGESGGLTQTKNLLVVMLGYRNISYLLMERGKLTKGETEDLGLAWLINKVKERTSGLQTRDLIVAISQGGKTVKKSAFKSLLRGQSDSLRQKELEEIVSAVKSFRQQHKELILSWLVSRQFPKLDHVILAGGTANYYRKELAHFFQPLQCHWADNLENQVKEIVGEPRWSEEFRYRLTDLYGFYFYLQYVLQQQSLEKVG